MHIFQYHPDILARYPQIVGGAILVRNVTNGPTPANLLALYQAEQRQVSERLGNTPLSQIEALAAWRRAFRTFGVDPTQYRSASEALLRRLTKKGDIPSINLLVDLGNLVSIRYALPVAVVERRALQGPVTVHFATGSERYSELGESAEDHPQPGEVIFSDDSGQVIARRWCWRQSESSAAVAQTRECLITVEAHHATAHQDIEAALHDLLSLLKEYAGGSATSAILDKDHPALTYTPEE
ncbi:MAG TPA: phenylalanine--tRNA ligase beta subunit-related protein [Ktedonobacteraceae bacterium]|nr:phenylalanine--tRNA ligase beta subunit-related protein [Ktedonobacteraceae bacterium]